MLTNILLALLLQIPTPTPGQVSKEHDRNAAVLRKIQPGPPDPEHLQLVLLDVTFTEQHKFLWWTREEPLSGKVRIEQKRAKDGFYQCDVRELSGITGRLYSRVRIDPTLRNPTVILLIVLNEAGTERNHTLLEVPSDKLLKGEPVTEKVVFK